MDSDHNFKIRIVLYEILLTANLNIFSKFDALEKEVVFG